MIVFFSTSDLTHTLSLTHHTFQPNLSPHVPLCHFTMAPLPTQEPSWSLSLSQPVYSQTHPSAWSITRSLFSTTPHPLASHLPHSFSQIDFHSVQSTLILNRSLINKDDFHSPLTQPICKPFSPMSPRLLPVCLCSDNHTMALNGP